MEGGAENGGGVGAAPGAGGAAAAAAPAAPGPAAAAAAVPAAAEPALSQQVELLRRVAKPYSQTPPRLVRSLWKEGSISPPTATTSTSQFCLLSPEPWPGFPCLSCRCSVRRAPQAGS